MVKNDFSIICRYFHYFSCKKLQLHEVDCQKIRLPSKDDRWLEFGNYNNWERVPSPI